MNRYPFWKYALIAVAVAIGFLYTLPNFFPEDPAVQVSSSKTGVKLDAALLQNVEDTLKGAGIPFRGAVLDATGVKVRFDDPDTQLKAKDALTAKLGTFQGIPNIVGAFGAFCSTERAAEIKAFFAAHPVPEAARALQQALERIETCTAVKARQSPAFGRWLAAQ